MDIAGSAGRPQLPIPADVSCAIHGSWLASFGVVFLMAAAVRLGWVGHLIASGSVGLRSIGNGEIAQIANNIAAGRGFSSPFGAGSQPTAWECPIVPYLYAFFITTTRSAMRSIAVAQALVSAFSSAMYWLIARRLSLRNPGLFSAWFAPVVAVVASFWPESIYSVTTPWYYTWQEAGLAVFVLLTMRWWDDPTLSKSVQVGLCGGALALINVTPLTIVVFTILYPAIESRGRLLKPTLYGTACVLLVIAPWLARNILAFHTFVALRSNTGYELFQGNNAIECIREPDNAPHPATDKLENSRYVALGEIRYCQQALRRAVSYACQHPGQTIEHTAARIYVSWFTDITDHWNPQSEPKWWTMGTLFIARYLSSVMVALAAAGIVFAGVITGRFRALPYYPLLAAVLLLLPLPHYFTLADPEYTTVLRMWLGVIAVALLALKSSSG